MLEGRRHGRALGWLGVLSVTVLASACAHVKQDDFQAEVDRLRAEMAEGDLAVVQQVEGVDSRVDALESRMNRLESQLRTLEDELAVQIERLESSLRVHLPVHFGFDDDRLDPSQATIVDRVGGVLGEYYPEAMLTVEGFTDPSGSAEYNMKLGQRRAETVRTRLVEQGWAEGRIRAVSYGESTERLIQPGAEGPGTVGRANRRAVVVIDHPDGAIASPVVAGRGATGS